MAGESTLQTNLGKRLALGAFALVVLGGGVVLRAVHVPENSRPDVPSTIEREPPSINRAINPGGDAPAPPEMLAPLGGLAVGSTLGEWMVTITTVSTLPETRGALVLLLRSGAKSFVIWITPKGKLAFKAPLETQAWSIYDGRYENTNLPEALGAIKMVVERLRASDGSPPGAAGQAPVCAP